MAKKGNSQRFSNNRRQQDDVVYAEGRLKIEQRDEYKVWLKANPVEVDEVLANLLDDAYRVTIKNDYHNRCVMVTLTQQDEKHHNAGLVITTRGDEIHDTVTMAAYKVFVAYSGQRLPETPDPDSILG